jgi:hypothetical protein
VEKGTDALVSRHQSIDWQCMKLTQYHGCISQGFFVLDTEELAWYDDADTKLGAHATKNLKVCL